MIIHSNSKFVKSDIKENVTVKLLQSLQKARSASGLHLREAQCELSFAKHFKSAQTIPFRNEVTEMGLPLLGRRLNFVADGVGRKRYTVRTTYGNRILPQHSPEGAKARPVLAVNLRGVVVHIRASDLVGATIGRPPSQSPNGDSSPVRRAYI